MSASGPISDYWRPAGDVGFDSLNRHGWEIGMSPLCQ
jgi:hypothetical protein